MQAPLERLATNRQVGLDAVAPLREEHAREQAALDDISAQASSAQQRVDALSNELVSLNDKIERVKRQTEAKTGALSGTTPLDTMRGALKALRAEAKVLALREALTSQQLASRRAAKAARERLAHKPQHRAGHPARDRSAERAESPPPGSDRGSDEVDMS